LWLISESTGPAAGKIEGMPTRVPNEEHMGYEEMGYHNINCLDNPAAAEEKMFFYGIK
jgi:hypothetical protein